MEDRELMRRIQHGQKEYLNDIAKKYYDDIFYFCCYQAGSREDAYDLAQETFVRFIRYVEHYRYQNLKGYLLAIAMNLCRNYIREKSQAPVLQEEPDRPAPHTLAGSSPERSLILARRCKSCRIYSGKRCCCITFTAIKTVKLRI